MPLSQDHYRAIEAGMLEVLKKNSVPPSTVPDNTKQLWHVFGIAARQKHFSIGEMNSRYENSDIESAIRRMAAVWRGERRNPFPNA